MSEAPPGLTLVEAFDTPDPGATRRSRREAAPAAVSRRALLAGAGATGAAALAGTAAVARLTGGEPPAAPAPTSAPATVSDAPRATTRPRPATGAALTLSRRLTPDLLVRRVTHGRTPELAADVEKQGMQAWLTAQLAPAKLPDPAGDAVVRAFPSLGWSIATTRSKLPLGDWTVMIALVSAHLGRALASERQLHEVLVDFWSNHLHVPCPSADVWASRHRYDADVIRKHALGRFEDMLVASATHPAMLAYLSNGSSTGEQPNENYARELLELHTVGLDAGYTERDVQRAALLLTGWTLQDDRAVWDASRHHRGAVKVMGFEHPNGSRSGGRSAQRAYLSWLARHPRTATSIARKLAVRFVADDPPERLVTSLAGVYLKGRTAIVPVLRALFSSEEFAESAGQKVRRPLEALTATARVLGVRPGDDPQGLTDLYWTLQSSGHQPLAWPMPDGAPDVAAAWRSPGAALDLLNTTTGLVHGWHPKKLRLPGPKELLDPMPRSRSAAVDAVARRLFGRKATGAERDAVDDLLAGSKLPKSFREGSWEQEETVALVATLLLTSPAHLLR